MYEHDHIYLFLVHVHIKKKFHNEVQNKICYGTTMDYFGAGHLISLIGLMQKIMYVTSVIPKD